MIKNSKKYSLDDLPVLFRNKNYEELKTASSFILEKDEKNYDALNSLAVAYKNLGNTNKAVEVFTHLVNLNPKKDFIYSNAGNFFFDIGKVEQALQCHEHAVKLNPKNWNSLNQIGVIYSNKGNNEEAINYYKKALSVNPKEEAIYITLANAYRALENYSEAAKYYDFSSKKLSKCQQLECYYMLGDYENFYKKLDEFSSTSSPHPLAATLSAHAAIRFDKKDNYNFCNDTFSFIQKTNLYKVNEYNESLVKDLLNCFNRLKISTKAQSLLKNGVQSTGNIFLIEEEPIQKLKKIIMHKIDVYKEKMASKKSDFITYWPKDFFLYGWLIVMSEGGSLGFHMHKEGWMSGSLYLKRPEKLDKHDGDIVFSKHGSNYPTDGKFYEQRVVDVNKGDMVLFPSSIFHGTVPFELKEQRITLAFDIIPIE